METATIELTGDRVDPADVVAVARHGAPARLSDEARARAATGRAGWSGGRLVSAVGEW